MAFTDQERTFLINLRDQGVQKEQALKRLSDIRKRISEDKQKESLVPKIQPPTQKFKTREEAEAFLKSGQATPLIESQIEPLTGIGERIAGRGRKELEEAGDRLVRVEEKEQERQRPSLLGRAGAGIDALTAFPRAAIEEVSEATGFTKAVEDLPITQDIQRVIEKPGVSDAITKVDEFVKERPDLEGAITVVLTSLGVEGGIAALKGVLKPVQKSVLKTTDLKKDVEFIRKFNKPIERTFLERQGDKALSRSNPLLGNDNIEFERITGGVDSGQWLNKRGFSSDVSTNIDNLAVKFKNEKQKLDNVIQEIPGSHNPKSLSPVLDESIKFAKDTEKTKDLNFLKGVKKQIDITGGTSAKNIIEVKRIYERNNKFTYSKDPSVPGVKKAETATSRDSALREDLINIAEDAGFNEFRDVSKEVQATRAILNGLGKKAAKDKNKPVFDITDRILGTTATIHPSFVLGLGAKKFLSSDTFNVGVAKLLGGKQIKTPNAHIERVRASSKDFVKKQRAERKSLRTARKEQKKQAILADELSKKGVGLGKDFQFIKESPVTREEQLLIRRAANKAEAETMAKFILQERSKGNAVGEGFSVQKIENTPLLNTLSQRLSNKESLEKLGDNRAVEFIKDVKKSIKDNSLDFEDAKKISEKAKAQGFDEFSDTLDNYVKEIEVVQERLIKDVSGEVDNVSEDVARRFSIRVKRMKAIDVDQIKDRKFARDLEEAADEIGLTSNELFNIAKDLKPIRKR